MFDALVALSGGTTPADVAAQYSVDWERGRWLARIDGSDVPQSIVNTAFAMPAPPPGERETDVAILADGSRALVVLSNVALADYAAVSDSNRRRAD